MAETRSGSDTDSGDQVSYAPTRRRGPNRWLITAGVLTGLLITYVVQTALTPDPQTSAPASAPVARAPSAEALSELNLDVVRRQRWESKVQPRLIVANEACAASIDPAIEVLTGFISERQAAARPFAEAMLTFGSKWKLVVSHLPSWLGGDSNAHRAFLEARFNEHIFTSEQMKQNIEAAVRTYQNHVDAIENQLLVDVRADLADLPEAAIPGLDAQAAFAERFEQLVADVTPEIATSLGIDAGRGLAEWVGGGLAARIAVKVLASVATRLGVSAGILGTGAGASWATFGVSVLAAIVVDQVVGWAINWATDPVGELESRVREMLGEICTLIIEGEGEFRGLRSELNPGLFTIPMLIA